MSEQVTTWYLEQTTPDALKPARQPAEPAQVVRAEIPSPEFSRFLYTAVGGDWHWTDRLSWSHERWKSWLERPGTETWVAWLRGTPAGYIELDAQDDAQVEVSYFGLLPGFLGRGLGGQLLAEGVARAWDLATRWPAREATRRVWVHTCSLDGPAALANYQARGFQLYRETTETVEVAAVPIGPWPGSRTPAPAG